MSQDTTPSCTSADTAVQDQDPMWPLTAENLKAAALRRHAEWEAAQERESIKYADEQQIRRIDGARSALSRMLGLGLGNDFPEHELDQTGDFLTIKIESLEFYARERHDSTYGRTDEVNLVRRCPRCQGKMLDQCPIGDLADLGARLGSGEFDTTHVCPDLLDEDGCRKDRPAKPGPPTRQPPADGGPAFPMPIAVSSGTEQAAETTYRLDELIPGDRPWLTGMSVRDYFAAAALQGFVCNSDGGLHPSGAAEACYLLADAMLAERGGPVQTS